MEREDYPPAQSSECGDAAVSSFTSIEPGSAKSLPRWISPLNGPNISSGFISG